MQLYREDLPSEWLVEIILKQQKLLLSKQVLYLKKILVDNIQ